jgi:23S rRNA pseudouridine2605 synthase
LQSRKELQATKKNNDEKGTDLVRLNKFIASSGFAARRKADELITTGRVSVNKKTVIELGVKIDPQEDVVKIDGEIIKPPARNLYILLNKPKGYVTTTSDELNRPTVMDLVKIKQRVYPVGRLDYDTEGLLVLTNDGDIAAKLMHPKYHVLKTYHVKLNKPIDESKVNKLREGVKVEGKTTGSAVVKVVPETNEHELLITIHEGRNRQIRKMMEVVGLFVRKLKRIEYAGLKLGDEKQGKWRYLNAIEVARLRKIVSGA